MKSRGDELRYNDLWRFLIDERKLPRDEVNAIIEKLEKLSSGYSSEYDDGYEAGYSDAESEHSFSDEKYEEAYYDGIEAFRRALTLKIKDEEILNIIRETIV